MALETDEREVRLLTQDEVIRMAESGALDDPDAVELLGGLLVRKVSKGPPHEITKARVLRWLAAGLAADRYLVMVECALRVPDRTSLPEPDIMLLACEPVKELPAKALLVIEVADSSLRYDREVKPPLYAAAGVPEYWSIDVNARNIRVHSEPSGDAYRSYRTVSAGELTPLAADTGPLDVEALFAQP